MQILMCIEGLRRSDENNVHTVWKNMAEPKIYFHPVVSIDIAPSILTPTDERRYGETFAVFEFILESG